MRYFLNVFSLEKNVLSLELSTSSPSGLSIIDHVRERLQRDADNALVFRGEILSFQVLFRVTEQEEVTRCEVGGTRWLTHQDEAQFFNRFKGHFGGVRSGIVDKKVNGCYRDFGRDSASSSPCSVGRLR
jgi:hypothetical protein